jgi:hypothetical protein
MKGRGSGATSASKRGNLGVTDRYYKYKDWINLSTEKQQRVRELKQQRLDRDKRTRNTSSVTSKPTSEPQKEPEKTVVQSEVGAMMSQRKPRSL